MTTFREVIPRLPVHDLKATCAFYVDAFGFVVDLEWPEEMPSFAILQRDQVSVGFFCMDEHRGAPGYAELYIEVEDAIALHRSLAERGVAVEWGPEVYDYGRREFAVRDPNGYLVIITEVVTRDPPA